jgi:hypothetical protein
MMLEWDVHVTAEFPEEDLDKSVEEFRKNGWDERKAVARIIGTIMGLDDFEYYNWGVEQTYAVMNEIKNRLGGVQLSMFDDEVSES